MKRFISRSSAALLLAFPTAAYAISGALGNADDLDTGTGAGPADIRGTLIAIVQTVLTYMSLICVIMIIVAGMYLIFSAGSDTAKEKAKKIIIYTIVGLLLIILSKAIIYFVMGLF
jgi:hypothetical protein